MSRPLRLQSIPLRKAEKLDFKTRLHKYALEHYGRKQADEHMGAFQQLDAMREDVRLAEEGRIGTKDLLLRYYMTVGYIEQHFPSHGVKGIGLTFAWKDAYKGKVTKHDSIQLEKISVAFNLGAVCSQLASAANRSSAEGIVTASKLLQESAAYFAFVNENLRPFLTDRVSVDLSPDFLELAVFLTLAQAQQCFVEKAMMDGFPRPLIAKLASAACAQYNRALTQFHKDIALAEYCGRPLGSYLQFRAWYSDAVVQFHLGTEAYSKDQMGEAVARLDLALGLVDACIQLQFLDRDYVDAAVGLRQLIGEHHRKALFENEKVYFMPVPPPDQLPRVEPHMSAKIGQIPDLKLDPSVPDMFASFVPVYVMEASDRFANFVSETAAAALWMTQQRDQSSCEKLTKHRLPGCLAVALEPNDPMPPGLVEQLLSVQARGGFSSLASKMVIVDEQVRDCLEMAQQIELGLATEEDEDTAARSQFGAKWTRRSSPEENAPMRSKLQDLRFKTRKGAEVNAACAAEIEKHRSELQQVDLPVDQVARRVAELHRNDPTRVDASSVVKAKAAAVQALLDQRDEIAKRRTALLEVISGWTKDLETVRRFICQQILAAGEARISEVDARERAVITARKDEMSALCEEEEKKWQEIETALQAFLASQQRDPVSSEQQKLVQLFYNAVQNYDNIAKHLESGCDFFSSVQEALRRLRDDVTGFTLARQLEMRDIMSTLTAEMAELSMASGLRSSGSASSSGAGGANANPYTASLTVSAAPPVVVSSMRPPPPPLQQQQQHFGGFSASVPPPAASASAYSYAPSQPLPSPPPPSAVAFTPPSVGPGVPSPFAGAAAPPPPPLYSVPPPPPAYGMPLPPPPPYDPHAISGAAPLYYTTSAAHQQLPPPPPYM